MYRISKKLSMVLSGKTFANKECECRNGYDTLLWKLIVASCDVNVTNIVSLPTLSSIHCITDRTADKVFTAIKKSCMT